VSYNQRLGFYLMVTENVVILIRDDDMLAEIGSKVLNCTFGETTSPGGQNIISSGQSRKGLCHTLGQFFLF